MLHFTYRARDSKAQPVTGVIDAPTQAEAIRMLEREGKAVTDIHVGVRGTEEPTRRSRGGGGSVRGDEVIALASQLSVMLETGVPLSSALEAYVSSSKPGPLRRVTETVADRIHGGMAFSAAIEDFPKVFPSLMVTLLKASEASGKMAMMLGRVAEYLGKERRTARQIRGALTYPGVMVTLALVVTSFLVTWVLPRFARIYESREAALPAMTKVLLDTSRWLLDNWIAVIVGVVLLVGGFIAMRLSTGGRRILDLVKLNLPAIGPMYRNYYITRATRTLATLLAAGVSLLEAVRIVKGVTDNAHWVDLWNHIEKSMVVGGTLSEVIVKSKLVPAPVAQMISAGERSGRLPEVLERIALASEADLDESVKTATQLIEPAMIVFMGATIGGIAIALLLPIFNVASVVAK